MSKRSIVLSSSNTSSGTNESSKSLTDEFLDDLNIKKSKLNTDDAFIQNFEFDFSNESNVIKDETLDDPLYMVNKEYETMLKFLFKNNMQFYQTNNLSSKKINVHKFMINIINKCIEERTFKMGNYRKHIKNIPITTNLLHINDNVIVEIDDKTSSLSSEQSNFDSIQHNQMENKNKYKLHFCL